MSVLTTDTLRQRAAGKAERLKAGGPSREAEIGRAAACFFARDWSRELRLAFLGRASWARGGNRDSANRQRRRAEAPSDSQAKARTTNGLCTAVNLPWLLKSLLAPAGTELRVGVLTSAAHEAEPLPGLATSAAPSLADTSLCSRSRRPIASANLRLMTPE